MEFALLIDKVANWIYYCTLLIAVIYSIAHFNKFDIGTKYICIFIWLGFLTESIGWVAAIELKNNLSIYSVGNIIELATLSLYFNHTVWKLKAYNIGIFIAIIGIVLGVMNFVFLQPINTFNSNFVFIECIVVVCLCLYSIFQFLIEDEEIELKKELHFWIACTLLFYQCTSLGNWGLLDYFSKFLPDKLILWHIALVFIYTITYISLIILFYYYPKLKKSNV